MSVQPTECPSLSNCPSGSVAAVAMANGAAVTVAMIAFLVLMFALLVVLQKKTTGSLSTSLEKRLQEFNVFNALLRTISGSSRIQHKLKGFHTKKNKVNIGFSNLGLRLKSGKCVLQGVSGEFKSSSLVRCSNGRIFSDLYLCRQQ